MLNFVDENYIGGGHQVIDIAGTAVSLFTSYLTLIKPTTGTFAGKMATRVLVEGRTSAVYYTMDGTAPLTDGTVGHLLSAGDCFIVNGWDNIKLLKFIRQASVSGKIVVTSFFSHVGIAVADPA